MIKEQTEINNKNNSGIKQILFYFYKMKNKKYYNCKPYNFCLEEKPVADQNKKPKRNI